MKYLTPARKNTLIYLLTLSVLAAFAVFIRHIGVDHIRQSSGLINFSFAFVLLAAYLSAQLLKSVGLPMISGYILAGIIAGPYVSSFLTTDMVSRLQLIDDLALNFIAFSAGGALHLTFLQKRRMPITLNILFQTLIVFLAVCLWSLFTGDLFYSTSVLTGRQLFAFSILIGAIAIARSPSSAMAIINECRASGVFTETILGVTVAIDVLVIIVFTFAMAIVKILLSVSSTPDFQVFTILLADISIALSVGFILGKLIAAYIRRVRHDLPLFLLFTAFAIAKLTLALSQFFESHFHIHLSLEPLLVCMSAGFTIQNFSKAGKQFMETLDNMALPIYVMFFSVAGAALNLDALRLCWPIAVCIAVIRVAAIFISTWIAGTISRDPAVHKNTAWMGYLTQAGVSIGLAQLVQNKYPEVGIYLTTVVLAVITINQIIGPITFKMALGLVGEAKKEE